MLTTPFGSLPEYFSSTDDFRYFTTTDELIKEINHVRNVTPQMRGRAEEFSWERIAEKLIEKYGVLQ